MSVDAEMHGKKLQIVKWAFDRFYEGGFHATAIDAAMTGSGISKRTLYKYFASKEDLIEAVLKYYSAFIVSELLDAVADIDGPQEQMLALFNVREIRSQANLTRGCLGLKAAQEYAGKHQGIVNAGRGAAANAEMKFIQQCKRAGFLEPEQIGKQLNVLFQGALVLSHVSGDVSAFDLAKSTAATVLEKASKTALLQ